MYCTACGKELHEEAVICLECGVGTVNTVNRYDESNANLTGWTVLGCLVPAVGLILYLVWKDERPLSSKAAGKGAVGYLIFMGFLIMFYVYLFTFAISAGILSEL